MRLKFQTSLTGGIGKSLNSTVVDVPVSIENNLGDALLLCQIGRAHV